MTKHIWSRNIFVHFNSIISWSTK